jgi:hypothetical protein
MSAHLFQKLLAVIVWSSVGAVTHSAPITLESAQMGPVGRPGGQLLSANQFIGWRFQIAEPMRVTEVGAHLLGSTGNLFAAIVKLSSLVSLPQGAPFSTTEVVAQGLIAPPTSSAEVFTTVTPPPTDPPAASTAVVLAPGSYALIFGSGQFDAVGMGGMVNHADQLDIPPTTASSFIMWRQILPNVFQWTNGPVDKVRLIVRGAGRLGPTDFNADAVVDGDDLPLWKTGFGATQNATVSMGDADGDGDVDGADLLAWQQTAIVQAEATGAVISTPEPSAWQFACAAIVPLALSRRA